MTCVVSVCQMCVRFLCVPLMASQAAIHLVRCPGDAIVSEWNRKRGTSQKGGKHSATASPADFGEG